MKRQMTRHHLIPKERKRKKNLDEDHSKIHIDTTIKLWRDRHDAWHFLFKNMSIDEIIECLQRVKRLCCNKQKKKKIQSV